MAASRDFVIIFGWMEAMDHTFYPIIEKLGGIEAVVELLRHPLGISRGAIYQWRARGSIPGAAMREMMQIAEKRKIKYRAADFRLRKGVVNGAKRYGN